MRDEAYLMHQTSLLNDPKYADMVLVAQGPHPHTGVSERRTFYCHKVILASRSTYFDLLFGSGGGAAGITAFCTAFCRHALAMPPALNDPSAPAASV